MRQRGWFKNGIAKLCASRRRWPTILFSVSAFGTAFATALLIFDGWVDAAAAYVASGLVLAVLLSRFTGRQAELHAAALAGDDRYTLTPLKPALTLGLAPQLWRDAFHQRHRPGTASPTAALGEAASPD